jgi:hypothetical protein
LEGNAAAAGAVGGGSELVPKLGRLPPLHPASSNPPASSAGATKSHEGE